MRVHLFLLNRVHENEKNHYSWGCTLDINVNHSGLNARIGYNGLLLPGDVEKSVVDRGADLDGLMHVNQLISMTKKENLFNFIN